MHSYYFVQTLSLGGCGGKIFEMDSMSI